MLLNYVWYYSPTPIIYAGVFIEAIAVTRFSSNVALLAMLFVWLLILATAVGSLWLSRPLHIERIIFLVTLASANISLYAINVETIHDAIHLHTPTALLYARIAYALLWVLIVCSTVFLYVRTRGAQVGRPWPFIVFVTLLLILLPIEPDAFVAYQPEWLWVLRVTLAFVAFFLVSLGDSSVLLLYHYQGRLKNGDEEHSGADHEVEVSMLRTAIWSPMTLWVLFIPRALLLAWVLMVVALGMVVVSRLRRGSDLYAQLTARAARKGETPQHMVIDILTGMDGTDLGDLLNAVDRRRLQRRAAEDKSPPVSFMLPESDPTRRPRREHRKGSTRSHLQYSKASAILEEIT